MNQVPVSNETPRSMSSIESQVRTNDPLLVLVSCNVLRKQYAAGKIFGILPHMGYTVPINSKDSVGWAFKSRHSTVIENDQNLPLNVRCFKKTD